MGADRTEGRPDGSGPLTVWTKPDLPVDCTGVVHAGANDGRERFIYAARGIPVLWIEALPSAYARLLANIAEYPLHRAVQALISDVDGEERIFHVSSNAGRSSSLYDLGLHRDTWPDVSYVDRITLRSTTLEAILTQEAPSGHYNALVMDLQGAELLALHGLGQALQQFSYISLEAADYEAYIGAATVDEIAAWMASRGFKETRRSPFGAHPGGAGQYYNITYKRTGT